MLLSLANIFLRSQFRMFEFSAGDLKTAGYLAVTLKVDFSAAELREAGFSAAELREAGFSAADLSEARFSLEDIEQANFPIKCVKLLVEQGADVNKMTVAGLRPINIAAEHGQARSTPSLMEQKTVGAKADTVMLEEMDEDLKKILQMDDGVNRVKSFEGWLTERYAPDSSDTDSNDDWNTDEDEDEDPVLNYEVYTQKDNDGNTLLMRLALNNQLDLFIALFNFSGSLHDKADSKETAWLKDLEPLMQKIEEPKIKEFIAQRNLLIVIQGYCTWAS